MRQVNDQNTHLYYPKQSLSTCVFAMICRDISGLGLMPKARFNYFPSSPLCSVSWVIEGNCKQVVDGKVTKDDFPQMFFSGPQSKPNVSFSSVDMNMITIGFFPDAWRLISDMNISDYSDKIIPLNDVISGRLLGICENLLLLKTQSNLEKCKIFENDIAEIWCDVRPDMQFINHQMKDWFMSLAVKASTDRLGMTIRQIQRNFKKLTGHTKQDLENYIQIEYLQEIYEDALKDNDVNYGQLAYDAGFSDQAHMGRKLKRVTGFSPKRLNKLIETDDAFWCYRLFAHRF